MSIAPTNDLPPGILVGWYGDDFTGSAAVLEVLSFAGLPSVLFLDIPSAAQRANFPDVRCIGIAGTARSRAPQWMKQNLPPVFVYLKSLNAPITHYKICSTLDSSPEIGSIGQAIDLAHPVFQSDWIPLLVAAPPIRRYQSFGHLFAGSSDGVYRLDRHPVMARHPVTPMAESDVGRHLGAQSRRPVSLIDLEMLADPLWKLELSNCTGDIVAIDTVSGSDLARAGELIWENRNGGLFVVGSQGIEYALVAYWKAKGQLLPAENLETVPVTPNIVVVSGSVSRITAGQIEWALHNGFVAVRLDAAAVIEGGSIQSEAIEQTVAEALAALDAGRDPIVFTACGPDDPAVGEFQEAVGKSGIPNDEANHRIGAALGGVLDKILRLSGVRRAVIAGGDTSGHATRQLGIYALSALAPTVPGAALFQAHSEITEYQNLQLALKGGQMGTPDYFGWIKQGGGAAGKRRMAA